MQRSPFGSIPNLGYQQLIPTRKPPFFELTRATFNTDITKIPGQLRIAVAADPLAIDIDVHVDIDTARNVDSQIRRRNRLPQSRCGRDRRKER